MQSLPGAIGRKAWRGSGDNGAFCTPAYFNNRVYYLGTGDVLKAFEVKGGKLSAAPVSQGKQIFPGPRRDPKRLGERQFQRHRVGLADVQVPAPT